MHVKPMICTDLHSSAKKDGVMIMSEFVTYEAFGAKGDGVTDDIAAIAAAHAYANEHGLPVRTDPKATYYIGGAALPAVIRTHTDWETSHFIIDDRVVENYRTNVFEVPASGEWTSDLPIPPLSAGQQTLDLAACGISLASDMYVTVKSDERLQYIRWGLNEDSGSPQTDSFILTRDGRILSGINWDYTRITSVSAVPIDAEELIIEGGFFKTIANQAESRYTYYGRGLSVRRSNTTVRNVSHTIEGEGDRGAPYSGFFCFSSCAYIRMQDCYVTGHKIYNTIGAQGKPVSMGSYDINCAHVLGITFEGIRQDDILNRSLWGVFGSNFCKQIVFDHCIISRTDAHCGVRDYTIRNSVIGWQGTNTIGFGEMLIENTTCYCSHMIGFRDDYGCTWQGNLTIRNVIWVPQPGRCFAPTMLYAHNPGTHNFGYPVSLPKHILIEHVTVVDTNVPRDYAGLRILANFNPNITAETADSDKEPYPLVRPERITIRGLHCVSGKAPIICDNPYLLPNTVITIED